MTRDGEPNVRIIGGIASGIPIVAPSGRGTRPTGDRVREALFNTIAAAIPGARVLDLYAGTGAFGLEALSRGAESVVWVEHKATVAHVIRTNWEKTRLSQRAGTLLVMDAGAACKHLVTAGQIFDVVLCDPPWREGVSGSVMGLLDKLVAPEGTLMIEGQDGERFPVVPGFDAKAHRKYGRTALHYFRHHPKEAAAPGADNRLIHATNEATS